MSRSLSANQRSLSRLGRFFRYLELDRVFLLRRLFGPKKPQAPPRPTRKCTPLGIAPLETISVPNNPFGDSSKQRRSFHRAANLALPEGACFVLTPVGASYGRDSRAGRRTSWAK